MTGRPRGAPPRVVARGRLDDDPRAAGRVRTEFDEMPGLSLTLDQASRFLAVESPACERLLRTLVTAGYLSYERGRYRRLRDV